MPFSTYESDASLAQYLLFHYGPSELAMPWEFGPRSALNFPVRCVAKCVNPSILSQNARALDVGCSVGRSTLELSRFCRQAVGVDASYTFIATASTICRNGSIHFEVPDSGTQWVSAVAHLPEGVDLARVQFRREDADDLPTELGTFDVVLAANLLCRLPKPQRFLKRLPSLMNPGGQLVITTPHSWSTEFTDPAFWLTSGKSEDSMTVLAQHLGSAFKLVKVMDLPFCLREHARKYQWSVAQASVWHRQ